MNTLFHSDLLNFGTIVLIIMIVGGIVVAVTMGVKSAQEFRRSRADQQDEEAGPLGPKPDKQESKHLPKSA
jgi:hypothetical protein